MKRTRTITLAILIQVLLAAHQPALLQAAPGHPEMAPILRGNTEFAFNLYRHLPKNDENLFFSPYSISSALTMTYLGARGRTERQMAAVLCLSAGNQPQSPRPITSTPARTDYAQLASAFGQLNALIQQAGTTDQCKLRIANALWMQKDYRFLPDYTELVRTHFGAKLAELDFKTAPEKARQLINNWVEQKTEKKITQLIPKGIIDPMTRLVLTNAIYFKGKWAQQFEKADTRNGPFILLTGHKITVPMMNQIGDCRYAESPSAQILELPYVANELSMLLILPRRIDGLAELEKNLTADNFSRWLKDLHRRKVMLSMPKFRLTCRLNLGTTLRSMGMTDAFSPLADFSGIDGTKFLYICAVLHKAYIDVNEEGTEAAAATGVVLNLKAAPTQPVRFIADHPFFFAIRHNRTGSLLFLGRLTNPESP